MGRDTGGVHTEIAGYCLLKMHIFVVLHFSFLINYLPREEESSQIYAPIRL
jgi:hypothetical protein